MIQRSRPVAHLALTCPKDGSQMRDSSHMDKSYGTLVEDTVCHQLLGSSFLDVSIGWLVKVQHLAGLLNEQYQGANCCIIGHCLGRQEENLLTKDMVLEP